jgi:hypothetical protein
MWQQCDHEDHRSCLVPTRFDDDHRPAYDYTDPDKFNDSDR